MSEGASRRFNKEEVVQSLMRNLACQHLDTHLIKQVRGSYALRTSCVQTQAAVSPVRDRGTNFAFQQPEMT